MIGKIIPRATDLKNGKMHNTINLDISREVSIIYSFILLTNI